MGLDISRGESPGEARLKKNRVFPIMRNVS
jgi:hypothetical protein